MTKTPAYRLQQTLTADAPIVAVPMCVKFIDGQNYHTVGEKYLTALIDGEPLPEPWVDNTNESGKPDLFSAIFIGLFGMFWARAFFGGLSRPLRPLLVGAAAGLLTYFVASSIFIALAVGVFGLLFGWMGGATGRYANSSGGGPFSGGWGGGSGGSSWGGSSGGGGFSGGGGSSAGGGASGSW